MRPVSKDAPRTMLGQFLEVSVPVESLAAALEPLRALGFRELETSEVLETPYAAVWDGHVAIGLHAREGEDSTLTFVRPELEPYLRAFRRAGVELTFSHLAEDEFHQAGLADPNGQRVVLNEARTYSPADWKPEAVPACGELLEYSLSTDSLEDSLAFWQRIGLEVLREGVEPHRWARLGGNGLVLGLHECSRFDAGLTFRAASYDARCEFLRALGLRLFSRAPVAVDTPRGATLSLPIPLAIYLVDEPAE